MRLDEDRATYAMVSSICYFVARCAYGPKVQLSWWDRGKDNAGDDAWECWWRNPGRWEERA